MNYPCEPVKSVSVKNLPTHHFTSFGFFLSISLESFCASAICSAVISLARVPFAFLAFAFPLKAAMLNQA